jgi:hypothetical protein
MISGSDSGGYEGLYLLSNVPLKRRSTLSWLHGFISHTIELSNRK